MEPEDIDLVRRTKNGEDEAFSLLVGRYHRPLLNFIFRLVNNELIVEDLGQEVFISVYRALPGFDERRGVPFSAWLFTVARNRCISELRKKKTALFVPIAEEHLAYAGGTASDEQVMHNEQSGALEQALGCLDAPFRTALLESLKGASVDEIARSCAVPLNTVKTRLFRAREKLRALLQASWGKEGQ